MISNRPYLLRAFHEWIVDSRCTPILVLDATNPRCKVPKGFAEGGEIVFNVSVDAVRDFKLTNEFVEFNASYSGVIHIITAPIKAVLAIYAEENGEGLFFDAEEEDGDEASEGLAVLKGIDGTINSGAIGKEVNSSEAATAKSKPFLKLVE